MNKYIFQIIIFVIIVSPLDVFSQNHGNGDAILGRWFDEKGLSATIIFKNKDVYDAKIIWMKNIVDKNGNLIRDVNNKDESLNTRLVNSITIIKDLKFEGDSVWGDGKLYIPKLGETVNCSIKLISHDTLEIFASHGIIRIGKTIRWIRD